MTDNEIKANYLDVSTDIFKLKEDFKNVQKPINDVVGKFFGTSPVNTTLAGINEFIDKHTHNANVANNFFGVPATSTTTLKDIIATITRLTTLASIMNKFLSRVSVSETSLNGPTLAEIKRAIDEQKLTREIIDKFFEGSKPQDITTTFSYIDRYIKNQVELGINNLLSLFFFNNETRKIATTNEIKANYFDIYNDVFTLKTDFEKVKIPHDQVSIKNIVYTVASGTFDWIRGNENIIYFSNKPGCYRFTIIHHRNIRLIVYDKAIIGVNTVTYISDNIVISRIGIDINISDQSVVRDSLPWTLEFVSGIPPSGHRTEYIIE